MIGNIEDQNNAAQDLATDSSDQAQEPELKAAQESTNSFEVTEAKQLILMLMDLQKNDPEVFQELISDPETNPQIHEALSNLPTLELVRICGDNAEFQNYLIQEIFLEKEGQLYRNDKVRNNPQANWSDKQMSLVGSVNGGNILTGEMNHENEPVRTKKDTHYKTAEIAEIIGAHADFLDGRDQRIEVLMAEVVDGVYNLTQLLTLDPVIENQELYQEFIDKIAEIYQVPVSSMLALVTTKYHFRMYSSKNGKNRYDEEDTLIKEVLSEQHFPELIFNPEDEKEEIFYTEEEVRDIFHKYLEANPDKAKSDGRYTFEEYQKLTQEAIEAHEKETIDPYPTQELIDIVNKSIKAHDELFVELRIRLQVGFYGEFSNLKPETQKKLVERAEKDLRKIHQIIDVFCSGEYPGLVAELIRLLSDLNIPGVTVKINEEVLKNYLAEVSARQSNPEEDVADQPENDAAPTAGEQI